MSNSKLPELYICCFTGLVSLVPTSVDARLQGSPAVDAPTVYERKQKVTLGLGTVVTQALTSCVTVLDYFQINEIPAGVKSDPCWSVFPGLHLAALVVFCLGYGIPVLLRSEGGRRQPSTL